MDIGAVIVAAGYGVLQPGISKLTACVDIAEQRSVIAHVVATTLELSCTPTVLVHNSRFRDQIMMSIPRGHARQLMCVEQYWRSGSADAVTRALPILRERGCRAFLVIYADMPLWRSTTLQRLVDRHVHYAPRMTMTTVRIGGAAATAEVLERYGRVLHGADGSIVDVVEPGETSHDVCATVRSVNPSLYIFDRA